MKTFLFIMLLSTNGQDNRFVLDRNLSAGDCFALLKKAPNTGRKIGPHIRVAETFYCERAK